MVKLTKPGLEHILNGNECGPCISVYWTHGSNALLQFSLVSIAEYKGICGIKLCKKKSFMMNMIFLLQT